MTTNGYLSKAIDNAFCKEAFIKAIDEVDASLDYCDSEKHNEFRGQSEAYQWAVNTLKLCQQYGKAATIVFLGSQKNISRDNIDGLFVIEKNIMQFCEWICTGQQNSGRWQHCTQYLSY